MPIKRGGYSFLIGIIIGTIVCGLLWTLVSCGPTPEMVAENGAQVKVGGSVYCEGWYEVDPLGRPLGKEYDTYFIRCKHLECLAVIVDDGVELSCE